MKYDNLLGAIGNTPLIRINSFLQESPVCIYGKLESLNPGGSIKDRTAYGLIVQAEKEGILKDGGTIVESTSGNVGLALAMISAVKGYRFIAVLDPKTPRCNINLLMAYGADIEMVDKPDDDGGYQKPRIRRVKEIVGSIPNCVNLDQYNNGAARLAHYHTTGPEIFNDLEGKVDVLVGAVSTGGHLCGTARYLKENIKGIVVMGVEPEGSVIFGGEYLPYKQNGTGLSFVPENYDPNVVDIELKVSDRDAFLMTRELAKRDGVEDLKHPKTQRHYLNKSRTLLGV